MLSKLTEYLTVAAVAAFVVSYVNLYSYYEFNFYLDVSTYFAASEIIFSSASLFFIIVCALVFFVFAGVMNKVDSLKMNGKEFGYFFVFHITLLMIGGLLFRRYIPLMGYIYWLVQSYVLMYVLSKYILDIIVGPNAKYKFEVFSVGALIFTVIFLFLYNTSRYYHRLEGKAENGFYLTLSDREIVSSDSLVAIGSNQNYYFLATIQNKKLNETIVVPKTEVKIAAIRKGKQSSLMGEKIMHRQDRDIKKHEENKPVETEKIRTDSISN